MRGLRGGTEREVAVINTRARVAGSGWAGRVRTRERGNWSVVWWWWWGGRLTRRQRRRWRVEEEGGAVERDGGSPGEGSFVFGTGEDGGKERETFRITYAWM